MTSLVKNLKKNLDNFDIFQFKINLRLRNNEQTSTSLGKMMTLGIIIFLSYVFFSSDFIQRKNPQIINQINEVTQRPFIYLDETNFTLVFSISDAVSKNFLIDPSILKIKINNNKYVSKVEGGYYIINDEEKLFHLCQETDFPRMPDIYNSLSLQNTYCLDKKNISLSGYWDDKEVSYFILTINKCQNNSESDIICKSNKEIEDFLIGKYFNIYIEKTNIELDNYNNPVSSMLKNYYKTININLAKGLYYYVQKTKMETDDGLIFEKKNIVETYSNSEMDNDSYENFESGSLFGFFLYSDDQIKLISRKYEKFQSLLASLGGIAKSLIFFGFLITKIQNSLNLKNIVINELYSFSRQHIKETKANFKNIIFYFYNTRNSKPQKSQFTKKVGIAVNNDQKLKDFQYYQKEKQIKNKCVLTLTNYIWMLMKPRSKRTEKEILFKKGEELYNKEVDIIEILKKLKEIDKLKFILLDTNQLSLFNLLSKPSINNSNEIHDMPGFRMSNMMNNNFLKNNFIDNYKNLLNKPNKSSVDIRIISLLDKDINNFLRKQIHDKNFDK